MLQTIKSGDAPIYLGWPKVWPLQNTPINTERQPDIKTDWLKDTQTTKFENLAQAKLKIMIYRLSYDFLIWFWF